MADTGQIASKLPGPGLGSRKLLSTRRGTIIVAALAGVAAIGVLLVFMSNYRDSVSSGADIRVLVAGTTIDRGTSGDVIADAQLFRPVQISDNDAVDGAVTDPSQIAGKVATEAIPEGQQLTSASFAPGADPIAGKLAGTQRAMTLPVGTAEGNIGQVEAGSKVDILAGYAGFSNGSAQPVTNVLARDVLVLRVPEDQHSGVSSNDEKRVTVRVTDTEASRIAAAAAAPEVHLWLTIRPPTLAQDSATP